MKVVIQEMEQWVIVCPIRYRSRTGVTHFTNSETAHYTRAGAMKKLHTFYEDWTDVTPEKFWTWKQFYNRGYRAVRIKEVLANG
jgi:hypothetical protein